MDICVHTMYEYLNVNNNIVILQKTNSEKIRVKLN